MEEHQGIIRMTVFDVDTNQLAYHLVSKTQVLAGMTEYLTDLRGVLEEQGWDQLISPEEGVDLMFDPQKVLLTSDGGMIGLDRYSPWFTKEECLVEEFIVGTTVEVATRALETVARKNGLSRIILGTRAVPRGKHQALARMYESAGYSVSTIELTKEIH